MKTMEEYEAQAAWEARAAEARRRSTRQREAERKQALWRRVIFLCGAAFLAGVVLGLLCTAESRSTPETKRTAAPQAEAGRLRGDDTPAAGYASLMRWEAEEPETAPDVQEDFENEKIEAALFADGYFRADVPLDGELQAYLRAACEESGVDYELMLALIRKETNYQNLMGDGGDSYGYCQVQPRWHKARMERLGVTDLMDPYGNFRVAADYLSELLKKYPVEEALTAYNSGKPGHSSYARTVMGYWEELKNG